MSAYSTTENGRAVCVRSVRGDRHRLLPAQTPWHAAALAARTAPVALLLRRTAARRSASVLRELSISGRSIASHHLRVFGTILPTPSTSRRNKMPYGEARDADARRRQSWFCRRRIGDQRLLQDHIAAISDRARAAITARARTSRASRWRHARLSISPRTDG